MKLFKVCGTIFKISQILFPNPGKCTFNLYPRHSTLNDLARKLK